MTTHQLQSIDGVKEFTLPHEWELVTEAKFDGAVLDHFASNRGIIDNTSPELNMSLAQVLLALNDYTVILVTTDIDANDVRRLGFIPAKQMEEELSIASEKFTNPSVNIVPSGGVILPVVKQSTTCSTK
jgi:hypothetical protein